MSAKTIRVATDVGGTFTDLVCFETDHASGEARACEADEVLITALPIPAERTLTAAAWTGERLPGEVSIVCGRTR